MSYIRTQAKCTSQWKQSSAFIQFLETLLLAIKVCTGCFMGEHKSLQCQ